MTIMPTIEPVPDYKTFSSCNPSMDFLSKSQVINQDIVQPHFLNEVISSCSSSSSSSSHITDLIRSPQSFSCQQSQAQIFTPSSSSSSSSSLNWSEFIPPEEEQECDLQGLMSSTNAVILPQIEMTAQKLAKGRAQCGANRMIDEEFGSKGVCDFGSSIFGGQVHNKTENPSVSSFVDGILDRDCETRAAFPELLDRSLNLTGAYLDNRHFPAKFAS